MSAEGPCRALSTARLQLLPAHADLAAATAAFYQRNAAHLAPWDPPSPPDFGTEAFQRERLRRAEQDGAAGTSLRWWLQPQDAPQLLVGSISLTQVSRGPFQNAVLGYAVDVTCEGRGLMREALQAVIAHVFSPSVNLHRLQAGVRPENVRSVGLLRRLGFEQEGLAREYLYIDGAWRDHLLFALRNRQFLGVPV